ncbi:uncharacterized protein LOC115831477 [Nomascus leucogenys]|uniref:uncharacterized protein LOC115831477 n=1 Tax=Nomascus leucogenys TaxID=61853 RepID=UPI00122D77DA|nr:uncharacterized protein LOC115831477 [Nomascus leucogenys]
MPRANERQRRAEDSPPPLPGVVESRRKVEAGGAAVGSDAPGGGGTSGQGDGEADVAAPTRRPRGSARLRGGRPRGPGSGRRRGPWKRQGWGRGDACVGHGDPSPAPTCRPGPRAAGRVAGGPGCPGDGPGPRPGARSGHRGARPSRGGTDRRREEGKPPGLKIPSLRSHSEETQVRMEMGCRQGSYCQPLELASGSCF